MTTIQINGRKISLVLFKLVWNKTDNVKSVGMCFGLNYGQTQRLAGEMRQHRIKLKRKKVVSLLHKSQGERDFEAMKFYSKCLTLMRK